MALRETTETDREENVWSATGRPAALEKRLPGSAALN